MNYYIKKYKSILRVNMILLHLWYLIGMQLLLIYLFMKFRKEKIRNQPGIIIILCSS